MDKKVLAGIIIIAIVIISSMALTFQTFNNALNTVLADQKIGLVINSPNASANLEQVQQIYLQASDAGIGRSNVYVFWNLIEPVQGKFDWKQSDILMSLNKNNNLKVTLYFSLINGQTLGPFPDWIAYQDLNSIRDDQVVNTLDAILTRYHIVDTVIIAGETDEYFRYNESDIVLYRELFENIYTKLKQKHPDVQIANTYSLHGVLNKGLDHVVTALDVGDFIGFTYFPTDSLNDITKTPHEARQDLQYALQLAGNKKAAFFEISWSTSGFVNGSEADQHSFVEQTFEFYSQNKDDIEFLTWYRQYDKPDGTCAYTDSDQGAVIKLGDESIAVGGSSLGTSEHVIARLGSYICNAGLINEDGTAKPAWNEFKRQIGNLES